MEAIQEVGPSYEDLLKSVTITHYLAYLTKHSVESRIEAKTNGA